MSPASLVERAMKCIDLASKILEVARASAAPRAAYVLGAPFHSNMGDQAQTYCTQKWIERNYPDARVVSVDTVTATVGGYRLLKSLRRRLRERDLLFLHSGYHLTDLYPLEEDLIKAVVRTFPEHRVIMLPQTVNYLDEGNARRSAVVYNQHDDVVILCRDHVSYEAASRLFGSARLIEFPDIVTTMIGMVRYSSARKGILLCLRNDVESVLSADDVETMRSSLGAIDRVEVGDTTISMSPRKIARDREAVLRGLWERFSHYRCVVTDRYHGTIFSLIAATPVVVISSSDHKLSSGVTWFPESFGEYVRYVRDVASVREAVEKVYQTGYSYSLPPYFNEHYYDRLREMLGGDDAHLR